MILTLFSISLIGGFISGLLGIGGAVVLIPLLFTIPPLVGVESLTMTKITGLTMIQVLVASLASYLTYTHQRLTHTQTVLAMGLPMGICSLVGATVSKELSSESLLWIFAGLVSTALLLLFNQASLDLEDLEETSQDVIFNGPLSVAIGSGVGFISGIVGAGGGFILIPLMTRILKIPLHITVGSSVGIVLIGATMGSLGKAFTAQVDPIYLAPVISGSVPGALVGSLVNRRIPSSYIRYILIFLVFIIAIKAWANVVDAVISAC